MGMHSCEPRLLHQGRALLSFLELLVLLPFLRVLPDDEPV